MSTSIIASLTSPAVAAVDAAYGPWGYGPGPWILLFPLFWILLLVVFVLLARRFWWRRGMEYGHGAEAVLRERYARGEVDETEYRQRLEVLRADRRR